MPTNEPSSHAAPRHHSTCVHDLIAAQAASSPDATAVISDEGVLTYRQLDRRANQLANHLASRGVRPGDFVAVQLERGLDLPVVLVGILKAGAAYVPIDPQAPAARRESILGATRARVLVTHTALYDTSGLDAARRLDVDTPEVWDGVPATPPAVHVGPEDLIYALFTSGTTGEPKGVLLEHGGISNTLTWMVREYGFSAADRMLQQAPYTFDAAVLELFLPLISGGSVVLARPGGQRDPRYLVETVRDREVTMLFLVPSMLRYVLDEPGLAKCRALRHVLCGGEALSRELAERFFTRLAVPLHNLYGPTETSILVLTWTCRSDDSRAHVPIGTPIDHVVAHVLDDTARPVPAGEAGELVIGGVSLARGYLGDPDLTAQRFIFAPAVAPGTRLYRTGDRVRKHPDGTFEFLGRLDEQVKIQGNRIELREIESLLRKVPKVRQAAVVVEYATATGHPHLVAYLETTDGPVQLRELRAHLSRHLPGYAIPSRFKLAERLPLSAHGKLDKGALAHQATVPLAGETEDEHPRSELEQKLADIWSELLRVPKVGIKDDFFELGGDSITCLEVIERARQHGVTLTPGDFFKLRRIEKIATAVRQRAQMQN
ncbi:amino acid adenylation domain-containing protein [Archangium gephyra]|uniref:amino acid adenylation domain-containing protein n=1 Tax=Archangium gephyra TaxID=48 RepID=UPI0035D4ACA3